MQPNSVLKNHHVCIGMISVVIVAVHVMMIQYKKNYQNVVNSKKSSLAFVNVIWSIKIFCDRLYDYINSHQSVFVYSGPHYAIAIKT